jgi:HlyD family secretion protein
MHIHDRDDDIKKVGRAGLILRIAGVIILISAIAGITMYRVAIWTQISKILALGKEEEPIPVLSLEKGPLQLEVQANGEIVGLESVPVATPNTRVGTLKLGWLIPEGTMADTGTTLARFDSTDTLLQLEAQNNTLTQNGIQTRIDNGNRQLNERNMDTDRKTAEMDYEYSMTVLPEDPTIFSQWEIINARLNADFAKSKIDNLAAKAKVQKRVNRSQEQVSTIARNRAQTEVQIYKQTLSVMEVPSPAKGLVTYRRMRNRDPQIGDNCQAGQVLIDMVDLNALMARIYVLEKEAGSLSKDKPVIIKLDALPDREFHGVVRTVSSVASTRERNNPLTYFTVDVTINDAGEYLRLIKPGMALLARVVLEKYDSCFVVPSSAIDFKNDEALVYIKKGKDYVRRSVKLGLGKHGQATILSGVNEKELIALRNPFEEKKLKLPDFSKASASNQGRGRGGPGGDMMRIQMDRGGGPGGPGGQGGGYGVGGGGMGGGGGRGR